MNKRLFNSAILIIILLTLAFFINNARIQNNNYFNFRTSIENLILFNNDFDSYTQDTYQYHNFDIIDKKMSLFALEFEQLKKDENTSNKNNYELSKKILEIDATLNAKITILAKLKSYQAVINKSYIIIERIIEKGINKDLNNIFIFIMTLNKKENISFTKEINKLKDLKNLYKNKNDQLFLKHVNILLTYSNKIKKLNIKLQELTVYTQLIELRNHYNLYFLSIIKTAYISVIILFLFLFLTILLYFIYDKRLANSKKELKRFKDTIENSNNIIIITDNHLRIKYVNDAFLHSTGYTQNEVLGKNPKFLNAGKQTKEFYHELNTTIYSGKKWTGEFINLDKSGSLIYEKATITPVLDDNNNIVEFVAIKLDTSAETISKEILIKKEKLLLQQSKMAALGEMLQNIAHQWRQPLSIISTASTGLMVKKEFDLPISKEEDIKVLNSINDATQHLSETINAFRDFFQPNKEKVTFKVCDIYQKTLNILLSQFQSLEIEIIEDIKDITITHLDNELIQVLMNLLNNSRDILETKKNQKKLIFIDIFKEDQNLIIAVKDNGGGIDKNILEKVFEPYFTTKHQAQGTGIGLYMCQEIITKQASDYTCVKK